MGSYGPNLEFQFALISFCIPDQAHIQGVDSLTLTWSLPFDRGGGLS